MSHLEGYKSEKDLLQDDVTVVMFQSFGVDLSNLSFTLQCCSSVPGKIYANEDKIIINNMEVPSEWKEVVKDSSFKEEGDSNAELAVGQTPRNDQEILEYNFDLLDDEPDFANEDVPETFEQNTKGMKKDEESEYQENCDSVTRLGTKRIKIRKKMDYFEDEECDDFENEEGVVSHCG